MMDKSYMNKEPCIHILAQDAYHDPAMIIGNKYGLIQLRNMIDDLINSYDFVVKGNASGSIQVFCNDGEGYFLTVALRSDISDVPLGYTWDVAKDNKPYPDWLIKAVNNE